MNSFYRDRNQHCMLYAFDVSGIQLHIFVCQSRHMTMVFLKFEVKQIFLKKKFKKEIKLKKIIQKIIITYQRQA